MIQVKPYIQRIIECLSLPNILGLFLVLCLVGCVTTRHLEPGQMLLSRVKIQIDTFPLPDEVPEQSDLLSYVSRKPNNRLLGIFPWGLGIYSLSNPKSNSWLNRRLRQWGESPQLYSSEEAEYSRLQLAGAMYNLGYMQASTTLKIDTIARRKVQTSYRIKLGPRYNIGHHEQVIADTAIRSILYPPDTVVAKRLHDDEVYASLLDSGSPLAPSHMQAERRRITQLLRNRGYYDFREEQIRFDVDTLEGPNNGWVHSVIENNSPVYRIGSVRMTHATSPDESLGPWQYVGDIAVRTSSRRPIRPGVLARRNFITPGALYAQDATSQTYSVLSDLAPVRSVSIQYTPDSTQAIPTLDVDIVTLSERSKELVADLIGTHSGGNLGVNGSLTFRHNNIFGGAEQLSIGGRLGYEELIGARRNHMSYGIETLLSLPRLAEPLGLWRSRGLRGNTTLSLAYDYQARPEFERQLLSASLGYNWVQFHRPAYRWMFKLVEVDYIRFGELNEDFLSSIPDYTRMLSYRNQFVVGSALQLSYNSGADYRLVARPTRHSLRLYLQSAGNVLYGLSSLMNAQRDALGTYSLMSINFAQFVRAEIDYSGLYRLGGKNAWAYHVALSAVVPYANSSILPIDLRYFSGGANSVRGWSVRELGPGSMPREQGGTIFHHVGDIKLDLSLEYRARIARSWELATFVDAGNVWTLRPSDSQPNGHFAFNRFYEEIALAAGLGLRWDFDFFILRLDAGLKLYDPHRSEGHRWDSIREPVAKNGALHFAIGYPF